jgi:hypothetical protein
MKKEALYKVGRSAAITLWRWLVLSFVVLEVGMFVVFIAVVPVVLCFGRAEPPEWLSWSIAYFATGCGIYVARKKGS